jgi:hypothetical protein
MKKGRKEMTAKAERKVGLQRKKGRGVEEGRKEGRKKGRKGGRKGGTPRTYTERPQTKYRPLCPRSSTCAHAAKL